MTSENRRPNDARFDNAWAAYVSDDARLHAPPDLEARAWKALEAPPNRTRSHSVTWLPIAASVVALIALASLMPRDDRGQPPIPSAPIRVPLATAAPAPVVVRTLGEERTHEAPIVKREPPAARRALPPVLMSLGASPVRDTEVLQLVRVRLPREALQALGVALLEPEAAGLVDLDVVIGEDGVARDIRYVRTGQEQEAVPPW
jgi:hypothetical protein